MSCPNPIKRRDIVDVLGRPIPIPCGECLTCRISTRRQYEWRLKSEFVTKRSAFVTFTYDDYHLYYKDGFIEPSLDKVGIKKFMNKLHRLSSIPFSYFLSAEYGDSFGRPHYHCLFFGLDFVDHYNFFHHYWKNGSCKVLPIVKGGIRYVLKYLDKQFPTKIEKQRDFIDVGREVPFRLSSHGLGKDLILSQIDNIRNFGCLKFGAKEITLTPYYRNKYLEYSDKYLDYYYDKDDKYRSELDFLAHRNGYQYTFDYVKDTAIAREASYVSKAQQSLQSCPDFISVLKYVGNSDNKKLARCALGDIYE